MDIATLITALPVILTIVLTQTIKTFDKSDKLKDFYFIISLVVGIVIGAVFSAGLNGDKIDIVQIGRDSVQNAIIATFVFVFKHNLGIRFPGDTGFVPGKFFGYTDQDAKPDEEKKE